MELKPPFLKQLDKYLLKNFPVSWSSRIHSAGIYGIIFAILIFFFSFIAPNDPRNRSTIYYWITLVAILSLLGFVFWMIYLLRFNVFKRYGLWKKTDTVKTYVFYFIITLIIVSWAFIPPITESIRANMAYSSNELAKDINDMNIKICQLENESVSTKFRKDTFQLDNYVTGTQRKNLTVDMTEETDGYYFVDSVNLNSKLKYADSVNKIGNNVYVIYECPDYMFIDEYEVNAHSNVKLLTSMDLYRTVLQNKQPFDKESLYKDLGTLFTKYSKLHNALTLSAGIPDYYNRANESYKMRISDKYDLDLVNSSINHITDKKYRWDSSTIEICIHVAYYCTLILSLLVLIYRHTTRKTFFLSLLAGVVLTIFTSIFIALSGHTDSAFQMWFIAYFVIFTVISAFIFNSAKRSVITGIGLNFLVTMTPFLPLVITTMYYDSLREKYFKTLRWEQYEHVFKNETLHYRLSEVGGFLLLIILLATVYQMLYKKWYSLPEE